MTREENLSGTSALEQHSYVRCLLINECSRVWSCDPWHSPTDSVTRVQDGKTPLSDQRLRAAFRGRVGILGTGLEPGRTVLLVDLQHPQRYPGESERLLRSAEGFVTSAIRGFNLFGRGRVLSYAYPLAAYSKYSKHGHAVWNSLC